MDESLSLLSAWQTWDHRPGDERAAANMVAACSLQAEKMGLTYVEFRKKLAYHRRRGLSPQQVVALIERTVNEVPQG